MTFVCFRGDSCNVSRHHFTEPASQGLGSHSTNCQLCLQYDQPPTRWQGIFRTLCI